MNLKDYISTIENYPTEGILFRDISPLMADGNAYSYAIREIVQYATDKEIDMIVGPEARGFIVGCPVAFELGVGFAPVRKPGKLPCETVKEEYRKEYGTDIIEIHKDAINKNDVILLHDDLLATGGTMNAACHLVKRFCPRKIFCNFIIELCGEFPHSRNKFDKDIEITSLLSF